MKKIISTLTLLSSLAVVSNADFARVEVGGGVWAQTPNGYATRTDGDGALSLNGTYTSSEVAATDTYVWALVKHPLPIIPNVRLEYVTVTDEGKTTGSVGGIGIPAGLSADTTFNMTQYDAVAYYNLLDNTFWTTIDVGLDIKYIETDVDVKPVTLFPGYQSSDSAVIPLLYVRGRVQVPFSGFGAEADVKAISDGTNMMYDVRAKVDYTFGMFPIVQPGIEIGYRMQKLKVDDGSSAQVDLNYQGVYAGMMLRF